MKKIKKDQLISFITKIKALSKYLGEPYTKEDDKYSFTCSPSRGEKGSISFNSKSKEMIEYSWRVSYHNGDSYDCSEKIISGNEKQIILNSFINQLEFEALEKMKKDESNALQKAKEIKANKKLTSIINKIIKENEHE